MRKKWRVNFTALLDDGVRTWTRYYRTKVGMLWGIAWTKEARGMKYYAAIYKEEVS